MLQERLSTLDEFGGRKFVIPAEVKGFWRSKRSQLQGILLAVFLVLPWIKINGLQSILIDVPHRHFEIFGALFLAHDTPLLFLILALGVLSLAFVTAVWGRVWCGWACPQTVFIDAVYRRIEIWCEGDYRQRRKLRESQLSFEKIMRVGGKWVAYFVVSSLIAHSFVAYFTGSDNLLRMVRGSPEDNWTYFLLVSSVTALVLFDFGWFREQFCLIMCPYGRFQAVLMDQDTVTVAYDATRGEPRKGTYRAPTKGGDCVGCNRCVQVCPTGIDIRNGIQMECIACTACIDACNEIMVRVKKPENLIGYRNLSGKTNRFFRPRVTAILSLMLLCLMTLVIALFNRSDSSVTVLRAKDTPYQVMSDGRVLNHFKVHIVNQSQANEEFKLSLPASASASSFELRQNSETLKVSAGESGEFHFFVLFPAADLEKNGEKKIEIVLKENSVAEPHSYVVTVVGPQAR